MRPFWMRCANIAINLFQFKKSNTVSKKVHLNFPIVPLHFHISKVYNRRRYSSVPSQRDKKQSISNEKVRSSRGHQFIETVPEDEAEKEVDTTTLSHSRKNSIDYTVNHSQIVKLNIGGRIFVTTKLTLMGNSENFFVPLLNGDFKAVKDENDAYFIDRNGDYFSPVLDFLRHRRLIIPDHMSKEAVIEEANFYAIDITPGICDIKEGLYTSTNWILFIERDPDNPWIFGISGVEEKTKHAFFQEVCEAKDGALIWRQYIIYSKYGKVYIKMPEVFKSKAQLYYRCPKSEKFPLHITDTLISDRKTDGDPFFLKFETKNHDVNCKSFLGSNPSMLTRESKAYVLCKSLIIMRMKETNWLLYLYSDLAFFTFNHPDMCFGNSFHLHIPGKSESLQRVPQFPP